VITASDEEVRTTSGPGLGEAVSFAWGDAESGVFGSLRIGLGADAAGTSATAIGLLFRGGDLVTAVAEAAEPPPSPEWRRIEIAGARAEIVEPLARWSARLDAGADGRFELEFSALGEGAELRTATAAAARASGVEGYAHLCAVRGTATVGDETLDIDCLGERTRQWDTPDWEKVALARSVSAWFSPDHAVLLSAISPAAAEGHDVEAITAFMFSPDDTEERATNGRPAIHSVSEPRLSTVYDREGRQRRAGLELWRGEDDEFPRRAAGEAACGTSLELGRLRLDASFFRWRMEGRTGVGRYDILRRT
jgi:hypothetical protein